MFAMKSRRIVVGQGDACDLNLCRGVGKRVVGVSRHQAVVSVQPDLQFYVDNVGSVDIVVNGARLRPGKFGRLPNGAVLDFAGKLLLFIQNTQLIERIARFDDKPGENPSDQGGQKEKPRDVIRLRPRMPKHKTKRTGGD
jgi:pSer/pThr/pTyr-binding forkhead associated (FHA) protein